MTAAVLAASASADMGTLISMNYGINLEPLSFSKQGKMRGILVDLMEESLGKRMGHTLVHRGYPWARAQHLVREGDGDGFCTNPTNERRAYALFSSSPALTIRFELFYNLANPRQAAIENIQTMGDMAPFSIVDYKGNNFSESRYPESYDLFWANTPELIIQTLTEQRRDMYVGNPIIMMPVVRKLGLEDTIGRRKVNILPPSRYHLGLRKDFPGAAQVIASFARTIREMNRDGTTRAIRRRYS